MSDCGSPANVGSMEWLGLAASAPTPRAWAIFTDGASARMWTTFQPHIQKLADSEGLDVVALYDRFAIKQAVVEERKRMAAELRATIELDGFGCACTQKGPCNTCSARTVLSRVLTPMAKALEA